MHRAVEFRVLKAFNQTKPFNDVVFLLGYCWTVVRLLGHSYIFWAAQWASGRPVRFNLSFWRGLWGLKLLQILPEVVAISKTSQSPVVTHAGGKDLCSVHLAEILIVRSDLDRFALFFYNHILVWSEIVPRVVLRDARNPLAIERACCVLNMQASFHVRSQGAVVILH